MQIFVKPYDRTLTLDVRPSDTVAIVKGMIQHRTADMIILDEAIPAHKMCLAYAAKPLAEDYRTLADYGVRNLATLTFGINVSAKPPQARHVLYLDYPTDRKAFSSDCFYDVELDTSVRDLKQMVLLKDNIVITRMFDIFRDGSNRTELKIGGVILEAILSDHARENTLPTLKVTHFSRRARASRNVTRLATDLLREVLSYSNLRMLAASASTCRTLREAIPPKFAHELVLARFPILTTIVDATKPMPPARELYESQTGLFDGETPDVSPTHSLDEYVFSLELTCSRPAEKPFSYVCTGTVGNDAEEALLCFDIPATVYDVARDAEMITAHIMATRRGTLRRAALYSGDVEDGDAETLYFEWYRFPTQVHSMAWIKSAVAHGSNLINNPMLCVEWCHTAAPGIDGPGTGKLIALFKWDTEDELQEMNLEDVCLTLEHWCKL